MYKKTGKKECSINPEDAIDEVNHIALINREDTAEEIRNFGFDSFCILDRSHRPRYGTWE